ncbi:MAG: membrane protein insertase YidC [Treponema sp.]|jgi:YidC/Oxa1 family membrane protein insertase|nr:membrane protein insertase YidC [Treponema sp.]
MEKKTLLAVVLSILVLVIFYAMQGIFFPPKSVGVPQPSAPAPGAPVPGAPVPGIQSAPELEASLEQMAPPVSGVHDVYQLEKDRDSAINDGSIRDEFPESEQRVIIETELLRVVLSSAGGDVVSWKLKKHKDRDDFVEMVLSGHNEAHAFTIAFGGLNAQPLSSLFYVNRISEYTVEFYRDFNIPGNETARFRLIKRYDFRPNDYMFELAVSLDGGYSVPGFNFGGSAYTLSFGPQMGPRFEKLDNRYDYRQYLTFTDGKRKMEKKVNDSNPVIISSRPKWAAISGKYFTCIAIPYPQQYDINFSEKPEPGIPSASRFNIMRPAANSPRIDDTYRFYLGPKNQEALNIYNTGNNGFSLTDMQLVEASNTRGILAPLEKILKWLLLLFYRLAPNYGIAIILLTLLVKILFFPLTKKSSEATLRMQAVAPKIKEIQEKYKDNRQKINVEMAELYKKEGYNPLSGCLPMLLQIPIFFAMYNLFNNHFDLRGAMFIPGWIPDLSVPEAIWYFPPGFRLPLLGWTALRLLPFIYVGSQLLYGKVTQTPDQQGNAQMKMMLYVMPVAFFFILYDVPSGLLIYWIFSNLLTLVQQLVINKYLAPRRAAAQAAQAAAKTAVIPPRKKK